MKVTGKLTFICEEAGEMAGRIEKSLSPDNLPGMETTTDENYFSVVFKADKIGTMLSTVDDYLMNAKIAEDMAKKSI
jgi:hypothetical protein